MIAIISDIHSNSEALRAVLDDIARRDIRQIICLGDVVGYGPEPRQCLDMLAGRASVTLMGNHDFAVLYEPNKFNLSAETACFWTRQQLEDESDPEARARRWKQLGAMPVKHTMDGSDLNLGELMFVHGSPRRPINEYVFPDDVYNNPNKIHSIFERIGHLCFVGHTHVPGVFLDAPDFYSPSELDDVYEVSASRKALINVGSVGQPRDRDIRASYVVLESGLVRFVRVKYAVDEAVEKFRAVKDLDEYLATRLQEGR
jgi:predicted phosphodiesterase